MRFLKSVMPVLALLALVSLVAVRNSSAAPFAQEVGAAFAQCLTGVNPGVRSCRSLINAASPASFHEIDGEGDLDFGAASDPEKRWGQVFVVVGKLLQALGEILNAQTYGPIIRPEVFALDDVFDEGR